MLIEYFLRLRIGQRKTQLIDDLSPHANPFPPAISADFFLNQLSLGITENGLRKTSPHLAATIAQNLPLPDGLLRNGRGNGLGHGRAEILEHFDHFVLRHEIAASASYFDALRQPIDRLRLPVFLQQGLGEHLVDLGDFGVEVDDALERLDCRGGLACVKIGFAERKMAEFIIRIGLRHLAELFDSGIWVRHFSFLLCNNSSSCASRTGR